MLLRKLTDWPFALAGGALLVMGSLAQAAQTAGPVTDDIGVLTVPKGAPVTVGGMWVLSGADSALGTDSKRGAEIAFSNAGNKVAGHGIKLIVEDDQCN